MGFSAQEASIGFVSTYPPTVCGLASFTASLVEAVARDRRSHAGLGVVDVGDDWTQSSRPEVAFHHRIGDGPSLDTAIRTLNSYDTVSIQHEFGIFAGPDGEEVIDLVSGLRVPTVVTFHTVLDDPSRRQRMIIDHLAGSADRMVVMSKTAADKLIHGYCVDPERVDVIPHGVDADFAGPSLATGDRPLVLTWGLIGPGKGLEWAIEAFADLVDLDPIPRYLIAGATHPHVVEASGESYRNGLMSLVRYHGLQGMVEFDNRYLDRASLARMVRSADLVILPYASTEQVTSGILVEAMAASKPVIATGFPHAVELLSSGAGAIVPHEDAASLSAELRRLLTDGESRSRMSVDAQRLVKGWYWPSIGSRFGSMMSGLAHPRPSVLWPVAHEVVSVAV